MSTPAPRFRPRTAPQLSERRPFTLVELLVVVAIIAVLAAMLLPSLSRARATAKQSLCMNHVRQVYGGFSLYATDSDSLVPIMRVTGGNIRLWPYFLTLGYDQNSKPNMNSLYIERSVSLCPSNEFYPKYSKPTNTTSNVGYGAWVPGGNERKVDIIQKTIIGTNKDNTATYYTMDRIPDSSAYMMLGDTISKHGSFSENGKGAPIANFRPTWTSNWSGRLHLIHRNRMNAGFFDGHVVGETAIGLNQGTLSKPRYFTDYSKLDFVLP